MDAYGLKIACRLAMQRVLRRDLSRRHLLFHHKRVVDATPPRWLVPLLCGRYRGRCRRPDDLDIVLTHNYDPPEAPPIAEQSLRYLGIDDYTVLRPPEGQPWRNLLKTVLIAEHIRSGRAREYLLYFDSNDALLMGPPERAIELLHQSECDVLMTNTKSNRDFQFMPEAGAFAERIAEEAGCGGLRDRYLNAGVFVGRSDALLEVFEAVLAEVDVDDLASYGKLSTFWSKVAASNDPVAELEFPGRFDSDQSRIRRIHPQFYPRMKVDYASRLAVR